MAQRIFIEKNSNMTAFIWPFFHLSVSLHYTPYIYNMHTNDILIRPAITDDAPAIASLIIQAMTEECCAYFHGPNHSIDDFREMMIGLVKREDSQYSYRNTICAITVQGEVVGISVSYDGSRLHTLRQVFLETALHTFGIDHSGIPDETQAGELYLDSLAVKPSYQGQGIATKLLKATNEKAKQLGCGPLALLVDAGNPRAERLYLRCGFEYAGSNSWGGHPMKHLILREQ